MAERTRDTAKQARWERPLIIDIDQATETNSGIFGFTAETTTGQPTYVGTLS